MSKIDLSAMFNGLQQQMVSQLKTNRDFVTHPGSKGDSLENAWIDWLRTYLPSRYSIDKAIVIDSEGNTSHQIDIVVYDNWFTPFMFTQNGFHYVPAEGVYAVFEVKPDIQGNCDGKSHIQYAGEKIESVRSLKRTSTNMISSGTKCDPRPLTKIVGGILTSTNTFTHENNETIEKHIKELKGLQGVDIGCVADYGSFYVEYDGEEDTGSKDFENRYLNYYTDREFRELVFSRSEISVVSFFLQLTRYLQQSIGTIQAIDLNAYSKSICFKIDQEL
ncbi:DUF6602 domain-containing protein [Marispirochaeta aestuarii]|uniref:DUF6602 domain-containing protein n=1 Tax=Marispirochaeta aestuarii TaxID=1963862 RepID=UPI0029C82EDB|nr:DUF6602 domain-containing protein [Marispirochaeta aestuarii]